MKNIAPRIKSTKHSPDLREWEPDNFSNVLREIEHLVKHAEGHDPLVLFRGHVDYRWYLECTLVRTILSRLPAARRRYPRPIEFHTGVVDLLLQKFGKFWRPSQEAFIKEHSDGIDAWYELMKRFQQYAEEDTDPKGTFLIDWTYDMDVALYFATYDGRGAARRPRKTEGAIWICDPVPTGKVWMQDKVRLGEILHHMDTDSFRLKAEKTLPLLIHPPRQTRMRRAHNQKPVYFSQMDFRTDMADAWCSKERETQSAVFRKIILNNSILPECMAYLEQACIDESYVYPE